MSSHHSSQNLSEIDNFLDNNNSNLSVEFSESISLASTGSSGSSYKQMKEATLHQQEKLYSNGKAIRMIYMDFHCGNISTSQLCDKLSDLQIQITGELRRLLNQCHGSSLKYSKFLQSLTHLNEEDMEYHEEFIAPIKATAPSATPFATVNDILLSHEPNNSKDNSNDILTWSTPPKQKESISRKKPVSSHIKESPLVTYEPISYTEPKPIPIESDDNENKELPSFTPQDRNKLIQAFLSGSINSTSFEKQLLERCNITPSDYLEKLIDDHNNGKNVKFFDICREITKLLENVSFPKIQRVKIADSTTRGSVNIFDMANAKEEKRVSIPHSKEQLPELRQQKNLFTWEHEREKSELPSRKLGVGAYSGTTNIFDQTPEPVEIKPITSVAKKAAAESSSGDIFGWTTPPKTQEPIQRKKRSPYAAGGGISSIPWGTENDYFSQENPHSHNLTKRK